MIGPRLSLSVKFSSITVFAIFSSVPCVSVFLLEIDLPAIRSTMLTITHREIYKMKG